jgi:ketosteroid isomerase-like protein
MTPEALMRHVAKAFAHSDLQPLLDAVDENTVWKSASAPSGAFRFGGDYQKRAGVVEVTSLIATAYHLHRFEPREIVPHGDEVVWGLFDMEAQYRPTGRILKITVAIRWHVRNGKLLEHQAFFDTANLLAQQAMPA